MPEPKHSPIGPSSSDRWLTCPGSVKLLKKYPPQESSVYAAEGTAAHTLLEERIIHIQETLKGEVAGYTVKDAIHNDEWIGSKIDDFEVTDEMFEAVSSAIDSIRLVLKELKLDWDAVHTEQRLAIPSVHEKCFGTVDILIIHPKKKIIIVLDYKHGMGVFVHNDSTQLELYGMGALDLHDWQKFNKIYFGILQPRHFQYSKVESLDDCREMSVYDLAVNSEEYSEIAEQALGRKKAPLCASVKGCRWCVAEPDCPAAEQAALEVLEEDFNERKTLGEKLALVPQLRAYCDAIEKEAMKLLCSGEKVSGHKIVRGRANRKWNPQLDEVEIGDRLRKLLKAKKGDIFTSKLITISQAEKLAKGKGIELDDELIIKPEGKLTIASEDDKRPEADLGVDDSEFKYKRSKIED